MTTYTNDNVHSYTIYCDVSSPGSYRTVPVANFVDCISACDLDGICTAVYFSDGTCYFALPPVTLQYSPGYQLAARPGSVQTLPAVPTTSTSSISSTTDTGETTPTPEPGLCNNGDIVTGVDGRQYTITCNSDTSGNGGAFETQPYDAGDFAQCADLCDTRPLCGAWVWTPATGADAAGGTCALKEAPQAPTPGDVGMVCGILVPVNGGATSSSSSSSSSETAVSTTQTITSSSSEFATTTTT